MKYRCADLFCGAGGAAMGLYRAGFEVEGWDINPQPHYPFKFHLGNALDADLTGFNFVWASPPCQHYSKAQNLHHNSEAHPDLVNPTRNKLLEWGGLWIIENVKGAPLKTHVMLCGTMFELRITKHRYFELNYPVPLLMHPCDHRNVYDHWNGSGRTAQKMRDAQGTPWIPCQGGSSRKRGVTGDVMNAIPPAYSQFLGRHAIKALEIERLKGNYDRETTKAD